MRRVMIAAVAALLASTTASAETFAIQAGHVIVDASKPARGASTVIVTDGKITRIEDGATTPAGATVVDLRDKTVMPGMIDVHVHLTSNSGEPWYQGLTPKYSEPYAATVGLRNALITARAGFTTVRDLGGPPLASIAMRDAIKEGGFPGPRIQVAGPAL
jgi:imidazolonepropionase-like amidohydrolase